MNVMCASKLLIVAFVGSVTLWYFVTPYIVQPHPNIVSDILTRSSLLSLPEPIDSNGADSGYIAIENWTKWQVYVRHKPEDEPVIIYARSGDTISFQNKAVMNMEWRSEYQIKVGQSESQDLFVKVEAPSWSWSNWGIYNHFETHVTGRTIRIVPKFLFGLPIDTIEALYEDKERKEHTVSRLPIVGIFTESPNYDRIIIQAYMNIVTLSVIFLLWANNPPETLLNAVETK